ncbi:aldo-keto reductase family 1 member B1-like isoform X2 [Gigantopelta aegis]|nr:aldo-keto reductase family 1 member B1-like isoform X2 [Gigantopelta aegis]XP_041368670.1 aldo-keto reductase family 1 member B1-like isoform X2 [Gigantopelta aegis]
MGYRHIDTAWVYRAETQIGQALREKMDDGTVKRHDLFITSKLWVIFNKPENVETGCRESLHELGLDYLDMFLMHWPTAFQEPADRKTWITSEFIPADVDYVETWKAMEKLVDIGLTRSIGVSNFSSTQLERLLQSDIKYSPSNLQIEINPYLTNCQLLDLCKQNGIVVTGYAPLAKGGSTYVGKQMPKLLEEDILIKIASKYGKTPAQVALRWAIQRKYAIVPKSITPSRIKENFEIFDFELDQSEMEEISKLNRNQRLVTADTFKCHPEYPFH